MKKYTVVVARYNESLDWLKDINQDKCEILVYNKGKDVLDIPYPCIPQENIGREASAYVRYIIDHYDNLPEFVVFLQGDPFKHLESIVTKINRHRSKQFVSLSKHIVEENLFGWYEAITEKPEEYPVTYIRHVAYKLLGEEVVFTFKFAAGAQYIVHQSFIQNRSLEYYQKIMDTFEKDYLLPWHLERIWPCIFKAHKYV